MYLACLSMYLVCLSMYLVYLCINYPWATPFCFSLKTLQTLLLFTYLRIFYFPFSLSLSFFKFQVLLRTLFDINQSHNCGKFFLLWWNFACCSDWPWVIEENSNLWLESEQALLIGPLRGSHLVISQCPEYDYNFFFKVNFLRVNQLEPCYREIYQGNPELDTGDCHKPNNWIDF